MRQEVARKLLCPTEDSQVGTACLELTRCVDVGRKMAWHKSGVMADVAVRLDQEASMTASSTSKTGMSSRMG